MGRSFHGLLKIDDKIFAFGSDNGIGDTSEPLRGAERYNIAKNSWKKMPDMPVGGVGVS